MEEKNKSPQAPEYIKLLEMLNKKGYEVLKIENVTPEPKNFEISDKVVYELRIVKCF